MEEWADRKPDDRADGSERFGCRAGSEWSSFSILKRWEGPSLMLAGMEGRKEGLGWKEEENENFELG